MDIWFVYCFIVTVFALVVFSMDTGDRSLYLALLLIVATVVGALIYNKQYRVCSDPVAHLFKE
jgi:hypothetical protein